ncbi:MAG: hypothetical protein MR824_01825 [Fusobacterium mortiferum]|nr:hypothetical protein [Fusobacterium mortiferum]
MYLFSSKKKVEGNVIRVSPDDEYEYFFGYYDKSPWDSSNRYMLCLKVRNTWKEVAPNEEAEIILIDTSKKEDDRERIRSLAKTNAWNVQQGCMLQWLGPDFDEKIIYNDFRNGKFCSIILNIKSMREKILKVPIYTVNSDGKSALTLDFTRLHSLRPGYGYSNKIEETKGIPLPDKTCIWKINLENGEIQPFLKYTDFAKFEVREEMKGKNVIHKVNHLMLSPNGEKFMVLYRWFNGQRKYTRLITVDINTKKMYLLSDENMVSHCYWKNNEEILGFMNKSSEGQGYYLLKDKTQNYERLWKELSSDGHPSYSPNGEKIITDTYPNRKRIAEIKILKETGEIEILSRVFAPFKYDNDIRCDLHPRWDRKGEKICFDSVFEGKRRMYIINI